MKKQGKKIEARKAAKLIEMGAEEAVDGDDNLSEDDPNKIDDEETGGEWITEENLQKHLSHGVVLPIVPTTIEFAEQIKPQQTGEEEDEKEDENPDFPAFDETQLPSMVEIEAKQKELGKQTVTSEDASEETSQAASAMI